VVFSIAITVGLAERHVVSREIDLSSHPQGGLALDEAEITRYITTTFAGVDVNVASSENGAPEIAWGDSFFIYDPDRNLDDTHRFPFATIVTKDYGDFDNASKLDRRGVFRLNIGVSKETYAKLFPAGGADYDFAALDRLMPHPVYGPNHWACALVPSESTFESIKPLLEEAHGIAMGRVERRKIRSDGRA
jgi:uncharacterized protein DUF6194